VGLEAAVESSHKVSRATARDIRDISWRTIMPLIFGFLAGVAVGAVAALLYAPKSGQEFRTDINFDQNMQEVSSRVEKAVAEMQTFVEAQVKQIQTKSGEAGGDVAEAAEEAVEGAQDVAAQAKGAAEEAAS
jgi:gas vesicle protein